MKNSVVDWVKIIIIVLENYLISIFGKFGKLIFEKYPKPKKFKIKKFRLFTSELNLFSSQISHFFCNLLNFTLKNNYVNG